MKPKLTGDDVASAKTLIALAFKEDKVRQDVTTGLFIPKQARAKTRLLAVESGIVAGGVIAQMVFKMIDPKLKVVIKKVDGKLVRKGVVVLTAEGSLRSILTAERTALNFLGHLSGVATLTHQYSAKVKPYGVKILDTRKTTPGFRLLEKYAVRCGGGVNHRLSLKDTAFIKDNHWRYQNASRWTQARKKLAQSKTELIIEVETLSQLKRALTFNPNVILLDNRTPKQLKSLVKKIHVLFKRPQIEASGGITLKNLVSIARTGVDRISVGALTHSVKSLNFSLEVR